MRIIAVAFALLLFNGRAAHAQCEKKITLVSSKTEHLDGSGAVQETVDEKTTIEISKSEISIAPGDNATMKGTIKSDSCDWKVPFKEGRTIIKAEMADEGGDVKHVTFTIEGKDGKVTLLAVVEEMGDRKIRVTADSFEEKKEQTK